MKSNLQTSAKNSGTAGVSAALSNLSPRIKGEGLKGNRTHSPLKALSNGLTDLTSPLVQPKLKIGRPNDKYEREADRMADQVMRMPVSGVQPQPT